VAQSEAMSLSCVVGLALASAIVLPLYASDPLVVQVTKREAGTSTPQVVLVAHMTSVLREQLDAVRAGRLRASSMHDVAKLVTILLEL
jgi:membrane protein YqaA with SNARE-associated domain